MGTRVASSHDGQLHEWISYCLKPILYHQYDKGLEKLQYSWAVPLVRDLEQNVPGDWMLCHPVKTTTVGISVSPRLLTKVTGKSSSAVLAEATSLCYNQRQNG